ncbi:MAG: RNA polymerase sigma factor [Acidobacteriaceae bacterium]
MLEFKNSILGNQEAKAVATQRSERSIDQIRRDVYNSHRHRVYALAYYMTGDEMTAEAMLASCFTQAFSSKAEPDAGDVDKSLLGALREDGVLGEMEWRPMPMVDAGAATGNILRTDMEEALRELPAAERLIFLLSDVEGYSAAKIASLAGRPEREITVAVMAVRLRLREAIAAIRKKREAA